MPLKMNVSDPDPHFLHFEKVHHVGVDMVGDIRPDLGIWQRPNRLELDDDIHRVDDALAARDVEVEGRT